MENSFAVCVGKVAPYYNIVFVIIVLILFIRLFSLKNKGFYMKPWILFFFALTVYIIEEFITIMEGLQILKVSPLLFPLFEMVMITSFIYMMLLQKEYINKSKIK